jgi:uncharacterized membrane protein (Fun14 family)
MTTVIADLMPLASTVGGGFVMGALIRYAIKKIIKIAAVIVEPTNTLRN